MLGIRQSLCVTLLLVGAPCGASVLDNQQVSIDLTNSEDAQTKATWSDPERLSITAEGLGWDGTANALRDGWVQTKPIAIGYHWRPLVGARVRVTVEPAPKARELPNGQTYTPSCGTVFVRHSPDRRNWSSWHPCSNVTPGKHDPKNARFFQGEVSVPQRARARYSDLLQEFASLEDTWWPDDQGAAVRWIVQREPNFFAKQQPFIGYLEVLLQTQFYGGQRVRSMKVNVSYGLSGLVRLPRSGDHKDLPGFDNRQPWRFVAEAGTDDTKESKPAEKP